MKKMTNVIDQATTRHRLDQDSDLYPNVYGVVVLEDETVVPEPVPYSDEDMQRAADEVYSPPL